MSYHAGPEFTAPDEYRCEALVKGRPSNYYRWTQVDHRCPKTANQMRGSMAVCHVHAQTKGIIRYGQLHVCTYPCS